MSLPARAASDRSRISFPALLIEAIIASASWSSRSAFRGPRCRGNTNRRNAVALSKERVPFFGPGTWFYLALAQAAQQVELKVVIAVAQRLLPGAVEFGIAAPGLVDRAVAMPAACAAAADVRAERQLAQEFPLPTDRS